MRLDRLSVVHRIGIFLARWEKILKPLHQRCQSMSLVFYHKIDTLRSRSKSDQNLPAEGRITLKFLLFFR